MLCHQATAIQAKSTAGNKNQLYLKVCRIVQVQELQGEGDADDPESADLLGHCFCDFVEMVQWMAGALLLSELSFVFIIAGLRGSSSAIRDLDRDGDFISGWRRLFPSVAVWIVEIVDLLPEFGRSLESFGLVLWLVLDAGVLKEDSFQQGRAVLPDPTEDEMLEILDP